jgi:hypothetical protein
MNALIGILTRLREPSSILGTVIAGLGGVDAVGAVTGPAAPGIASGEFATALGVVIAGILAFFLKEKGENNGR